MIYVDPTDFLYNTVLLCRMNGSSNKSVVEGSTVEIWMDETNQQIFMTLKAKIVEAYQNLAAAVVQQGISIYIIF